MRTCPKCGCAERNARDRCVECTLASAARYRRNHRTRIRAYEDKRRRANLVEHCARVKKHYRNNTAAILARVAVRYRENADAERAKDAAYRRLHPDRVRAIAAKSRSLHLPATLARNAARRALKQNAPGRGISATERQEILDASLGICSYCNERRPLSLDHIVPLTLGGAHDVDNCAAACQLCNSSKSNKPLLLWLAERANARQAVVSL